MSDLLPHASDDLRELHHCGCSIYLCPVCTPRRTLLRAQLELSLRRAPARVVCLAEERERRKR